MGRRGFSSGGRGGGGGGGGGGGRVGGGGGGGSRPACRSKASRDAEGNILIQRAAASNGLRSTWDRIWYGPDNSHEDLCKSLVRKFEMCVADSGGDRDLIWCQTYKRELEEHCAELKSSWNDWWANEKKIYCDLMLSGFKSCWERQAKESAVRQYQIKKLKKMCGIELE